MLKHISVAILLALSLAMVSIGPRSTAASQTTYDTSTIAGKAAAVQAAQSQGLEIGLSGFILQEADTSDLATNPTPNDPITPSFVLSSNPSPRRNCQPGHSGRNPERTSHRRRP